jgi:hypothetical protein
MVMVMAILMRRRTTATMTRPSPVHYVHGEVAEQKQRASSLSIANHYVCFDNNNNNITNKKLHLHYGQRGNMTVHIYKHIK